MLLTSALAVITHSFGGAERAKAFAVWGASLGIALTVGPIIGGAHHQSLWMAVGIPRQCSRVRRTNHSDIRISRRIL
jgi:MFS family permease